MKTTSCDDNNQPLNKLLNCLKFIFLFLILISPRLSSAEVFKWIDENGKTVFSNVTPPQGAKVVIPEKTNPRQTIKGGSEEECRSTWGSNEEMVKKCRYIGYANQVVELNTEIKNKGIETENELYRMVDQALIECRKQYKKGTIEFKKCNQEIQAEKDNIDVKYRKKTTVLPNSIKPNCEKEWKDDYKMVEYCIKEQSTAFHNISSKSGPILKKCRDEWGTDYKMVEYCTKEQTAAKNRLDNKY